MKDNVRVTVNPHSGNILIGSTYGNIQDAVEIAVVYLNDPANKDNNINFYCDYGKTAIDFPHKERKESYTSDDLWAIIQSSRGQKVNAPKPPSCAP